MNHQLLHKLTSFNKPQPKTTLTNHHTASAPPDCPETPRTPFLSVLHCFEGATCAQKKKGSEPVLLGISKLNSAELLQLIPQEGPALIFPCGKARCWNAQTNALHVKRTWQRRRLSLSLSLSRSCAPVVSRQHLRTDNWMILLSHLYLKKEEERRTGTSGSSSCRCSLFAVVFLFTGGFSCRFSDVSQGLQGWWGDWNISPTRRGWGSWACSAWRREGCEGTL